MWLTAAPETRLARLGAILCHLLEGFGRSFVCLDVAHRLMTPNKE